MMIKLFPLLVSFVVLLQASDASELVENPTTRKSMLESGLAWSSPKQNLRRQQSTQEIFEGTQVTDATEIPTFAVHCFGGATDCGGCGGVLIDSE